MQTLKTKKEFDTVYKNGFLRYGKSFALYVYKERANPQNPHLLPSKSSESKNAKSKVEHQESKIGLSVSKKIGNAVTRNKIKRRVKAILRDCQKDFREIERGFRIIFVAKAGVDVLSFSELKLSFEMTLGFALEKLKSYKNHTRNNTKIPRKIIQTSIKHTNKGV